MLLIALLMVACQKPETERLAGADRDRSRLHWLCRLSMVRKRKSMHATLGAG